MCRFCRESFASAGIANHLNTCKQRVATDSSKNIRLKISDPYQKEYWLIVEATLGATFKNLDNLIREYWTECCGHLSEFTNQGNTVAKSKNIVDTFSVYNKLEYTYDFGSSADLEIQLIGSSDFKLSKDKKKVEIVARNIAPQIICTECKKAKAIYVCPICNYEADTLICEACKDAKHFDEDKEHYPLEIANSPRSGVCGYEQIDEMDELFDY